MVNHVLLENDALPDGALYDGDPAAEPGDTVHRLMPDGSVRLEVVTADLSLVVVLHLTTAVSAVVAKLGETAEGALTFDGQPSGGATPAPILALTTAPTLGTITAGMVPGDVTIDEGLATRTPAGAVTASTALRRTPVASADLAGWDAGTGWVSAAAVEGENVILRVTYTAEDAASLVAYATTSVQAAAVIEPADLTTNVEGTASFVTGSEGEIVATLDANLDALDGDYTFLPADVAGGTAHNDLPPSITQSGNALSAIGGVWFSDHNFGALVITKQWLRDGADIAGATAAAYTLVLADYGASITLRETATNDAGAWSAVSNALAIPAAVAPTHTAQPTITGTAQVGQTLTMSPGTWNGTLPMTFAYQWRKNGSSVIPGATGQTYVPVAADQGAFITVIETATNAAGSASASSASTTAVAAAYDPVSALGADLIGGYDTRDFGSMNELADGTGAITNVGQPVRYIRDFGPLGNHFKAAAETVPGNAISAIGALDWNDAGFIPAATFTGISESTTGLEIYAVLDAEDDAAFTLMGTSGNTARYIGVASNSASLSHGNTTVVSYSAGSTIIADMTQAALHAAWVAPTGYVVAGAQGIAGLASSVRDGFMPLGVANSASIATANRLNGSVRYFIITLALTPAKRADLIAFLETVR